MKRMNPKARAYLLTFRPEPEAHGWVNSGGQPFNGRWAVQRQDDHPCSVGHVEFFATSKARAEWVAKNPQRRKPVGKRHPLVKAFRKHGG